VVKGDDCFGRDFEKGVECEATGIMYVALRCIYLDINIYIYIYIYLTVYVNTYKYNIYIYIYLFICIICNILFIYTHMTYKNSVCVHRLMASGGPTGTRKRFPLALPTLVPLAVRFSLHIDV